ncbi:hypothetical protein C8R43DRAFT_943184 [Mycena crocata]|nr:hypothetical protein C8R43DRAFT_943184 [Mycena crocata]
MPPSASQRCFDEEERQLRRQATYRRYRRKYYQRKLFFKNPTYHLPATWKLAAAQQESAWRGSAPRRPKQDDNSTERHRHATGSASENRLPIERGAQRRGGTRLWGISPNGAPKLASTGRTRSLHRNQKRNQTTATMDGRLSEILYKLYLAQAQLYRVVPVQSVHVRQVFIFSLLSPISTGAQCLLATFRLPWGFRDLGNTVPHGISAESLAAIGIGSAAPFTRLAPRRRDETHPDVHPGDVGPRGDRYRMGLQCGRGLAIPAQCELSPQRPSSLQRDETPSALTAMSIKPQLVPTNLSVEEVVMDARGTRDSRYYCLPPFYGDLGVSKPKGGNYQFYLVFQGHKVGVFDNWGEAKTSIAGYPDAGYRGFDTLEAAINAWQKMCPWGVHPHPVDPAAMATPTASAARHVNTTPRRRAVKAPGVGDAGIKREETIPPAGSSSAELLADLKKYCSPILPPPPVTPSRSTSTRPNGSPVKGDGADFINFVIRGGGIVSSSAERSEQRYLDLQRRGEQPDLLVTRNFEQASLFALEDEEVIRGCTAIQKALSLLIKAEIARASAFPSAPLKLCTMPRQGTAQRRRERQGIVGPVKPGKRGWVYGTKLPFMLGFRDDYRASAEGKTTGALYTRIAHLYISTYGWHTAWDDDLVPGQTVAADVDPNEDVDSLLPEVAAWRAEYFKILRGKIGVWLNSQFGGAVSKKTKPVTFKKLFNAPEMEPPAPVKPRVLHYYSRRFYNERVSGRVAARWAVVARQRNAPAILTVRNEVTKQCWESETEAFRQEVMTALEAEHKIALDAYAVALATDSPTTAEDFDVCGINAELDRALNNAGYYLQPFADAMSDHFGVNVAIMLCGPVPDQGGRIEVRSVHSGTSNGLVPRVWSDFDRGGFDLAQRSFVDFSHHCFSEEQCRARSLNGMPMAESDSNHMSTTPPREDVDVSDRQRDTESGPTLQGDDLTGPPPLDIATPPRSPDNDDAPISPQGGDMPGPRPEPNLGKALARELAKMGGHERELRMEQLRGMDASMVEEETNMARDRLLLRRLERGISVNVALTMDSDDEGDDDDDALGQAEEKEGEGQDETEKEREEAIATSERQHETALVHKTPVTLSSALSTASPPSPPTTTTPGRPVPRPLLQQLCIPQRPDRNRDAEGPLEAPGDDEGLARPETNRDAEGPLLPHNWKPPAVLPAETPPAVLPAETPPAVLPAETGEREKGDGNGKAAQQEREEGDMWETEDTSGWPEELKMAWRAFSRAREWGGDEWDACVKNLVALERAWGFPAKGLLSAPSGKKSPEEVPAWMRGHRKWQASVTLASPIGPRDDEESYAGRWWSWWMELQPAVRKEGEDLLEVEKVDAEEWDDVGKTHGRNGLLLYIGGLLWWGEAAAGTVEEEESDTLLDEWREAVVDVSAVLVEAVKRVGAIRQTVGAGVTKKVPAKKAPAKKTVSKAAATTRANAASPPSPPAAAKTRSSKRKAAASADDVDKENTRPKKRTRSSR